MTKCAYPNIHKDKYLTKELILCTDTDIKYANREKSEEIVININASEFTNSDDIRSTSNTEDPLNIKQSPRNLKIIVNVPLNKQPYKKNILK